MTEYNLKSCGRGMSIGNPIDHNSYPYGILRDSPGCVVICDLSGSALEIGELEDGVMYKLKACDTPHDGYEYMTRGMTGWIWYDQLNSDDEQKWKISITDDNYSFENVGYPGEYLAYDDDLIDDYYHWLMTKDSPELWEIATPN